MPLVRMNGRNGQTVRNVRGSTLCGNALFELVIRTITSIMVTVPFMLLNEVASVQTTPMNAKSVS